MSSLLKNLLKEDYFLYNLKHTFSLLVQQTCKAEIYY